MLSNKINKADKRKINRKIQHAIHNWLNKVWIYSDYNPKTYYDLFVKTKKSDIIKQNLSICLDIIEGEVINRKRLISPGYYKTYDWQELKYKAKKRDKYKCVQCGSKDNLQVHHKDYRMINNDLSSLITLCKICHTQKHITMQKIKFDLIKNKV